MVDGAYIAAIRWYSILMPEGSKVYGSELTRRCYGNEQLDTWFKYIIDVWYIIPLRSFHIMFNLAGIYYGNRRLGTKYL